MLLYFRNVVRFSALPANFCKHDIFLKPHLWNFLHTPIGKELCLLQETTFTPKQTLLQEMITWNILRYTTVSLHGIFHVISLLHTPKIYVINSHSSIFFNGITHQNLMLSQFSKSNFLLEGILMKLAFSQFQSVYQMNWLKEQENLRQVHIRKDIDLAVSLNTF